MVELHNLAPTTIFSTPENIQYCKVRLLVNEKSGSINTMTLQIYKPGSTTPEKTESIKIGAYDTLEFEITVMPGREVKGLAESNTIEVIAEVEQH